MTLKYLIEKEFKQIVRNPFLPKMILVMPIVMMLLMPFAANFEIKNINVTIVDNDHSPLSRRLTGKIAASDYFHLKTIKQSYNEAMEDIESGESDIILTIPVNFEKDLIKEGLSMVSIAANAVNGTKGSIGSSYLAGITSDYSTEIRNEWFVEDPITNNSHVNIIPQNLFNSYMNYKIFMVPALMVMLLTMICGFMPALNIVSEKEKGTIEQINVTPIGKFTFILAKLLPYWIIGFIILNICFLIAYIVYGLTPVGSIITLYLAATIFVLTVSGLGLIISNYSETMQQAMFTMWFFVLIMILMSGLFTPITSMPDWAQSITDINPLKYFIQIMRFVYLKGSNVVDLTTQFIWLLCFAIIFNTWAVVSYRKRS